MTIDLTEKPITEAEEKAESETIDELDQAVLQFKATWAMADELGLEGLRTKHGIYSLVQIGWQPASVIEARIKEVFLSTAHGVIGAVAEGMTTILSEALLDELITSEALDVLGHRLGELLSACAKEAQDSLDESEPLPCDE